MATDDPGSLMRVHSKDLHEHIAQEVGDCLESGLYTDLMIRCKEGQTLHAHKLVLSAVSPYIKWLLENNEWEELQTLELPDANLEELQLLLEVVYNGSVEATIENLRDLILLAHRLYISIPLSEELMEGLELTLPDLPPFMAPPKVSSLLSLLKTKVDSPLHEAPSSYPPPSSKAPTNPLMKLKPLLPLPPPLSQQQPSPQAVSSSNGTSPFRRKLDPSVMTAIMANSKNSEHVCPLCNLKFNKATSFKAHMKSHEDNDELREQRNAVLGEMIATCFNPQTSLYTCHVCNSNYNHSGNFKQHLLKHERESGSISATLVAQVGGNAHLNNVLQSAMTDRVDKCDKESEDKYQYRCEHCGRAFKHPGNYKQHVQSHTKSFGMGMKRYPDSFSSETSPKSMRMDGSDNSQFSQSIGCPACPLELPNVESLQTHIATVHKQEGDPDGDLQWNPGASVFPSKQMFKCEICNQGFRSEAFLNQHKMSFHKMSSVDDGESAIVRNAKGFECIFCGKGFDKMSKLTQHIKIHSHPEDHYRYPCDICGKKFTRPHHVSRHKLLHTGENPFKCQKCGAGFPRIESLRTHEARGCGQDQAFRYRVERLSNGKNEEEDPSNVSSWHVPVDEDDEAPEEMVVEMDFPEVEDGAESDESLEEVGAMPASDHESPNGNGAEDEDFDQNGKEDQ